MVLFLFLTHLAIGIVFTLMMVSREAGVKFFRFNAGLALALLIAGMLFGQQSSVPSGAVRFGNANVATIPTPRCARKRKRTVDSDMADG